MKKKIILFFIISTFITSIISVKAYSYLAKDIKYIRKDGTESNVEEAINELDGRLAYMGTTKWTSDEIKNNSKTIENPKGYKNIIAYTRGSNFSVTWEYRNDIGKYSVVIPETKNLGTTGCTKTDKGFAIERITSYVVENTEVTYYLFN